MSAIKVASETHSSERKSEIDQLDPVLEVNENSGSELFDRPQEEGEWEAIDPKIFAQKNVTEPLTIEALNNAIYELGVVNLCWPEINEPVFETRSCFPKSYYTNTNKERLLLAYAENFRRQFHFHYKVRKPLFLQAPNECGMQKMVCSSIRPTKLCYADTNTWQGLASLVSDYFDYEPLRKPMLHVPNIDCYIPGMAFLCIVITSESAKLVETGQEIGPVRARTCVPAKDFSKKTVSYSMCSKLSKELSASEIFSRIAVSRPQCTLCKKHLCTDASYC